MMISCKDFMMWNLNFHRRYLLKENFKNH